MLHVLPILPFLPLRSSSLCTQALRAIVLPPKLFVSYNQVSHPYNMGPKINRESVYTSISILTFTDIGRQSCAEFNYRWR